MLLSRCLVPAGVRAAAARGLWLPPHHAGGVGERLFLHAGWQSSLESSPCNVCGPRPAACFSSFLLSFVSAHTTVLDQQRRGPQVCRLGRRSRQVWLSLLVCSVLPRSRWRTSLLALLQHRGPSALHGVSALRSEPCFPALTGLLCSRAALPRAAECALRSAWFHRVSERASAAS